jgi:DNA-binding GntR family transcriptional regulator
MGGDVIDKKRQGAKKAATRKTKPASEAVHRPPAQEISEAIIDLIERQVFVPGEPLREQDLANRFDITRGRVREALNILEARGFVQIERMKGATVARHDSTEYVAIGEVRRVLMGLAAKRAATHATDAQRDEILKTARDLVAKGADLPPQDFRRLTIRLANIICLAADSPYLKRLVDDAHRVRLYRTMSVATQARRVQSGKNWLRVAEAIGEGDGSAASKLVDKIYEQALSSIRDAIAAAD